MHIQTLGGIMGACTIQELKNIPKDALDFDAMSAMGEHGKWDIPEKVDL